jgi:hypothetical protein
MTLKQYLEKDFFGYRLEGKCYLRLNQMCYLVSENEIKGSDARWHKIGSFYVYCVMKGTKKMEKLIEKGAEEISEKDLFKEMSL